MADMKAGLMVDLTGRLKVGLKAWMTVGQTVRWKAGGKADRTEARRDCSTLVLDNRLVSQRAGPLADL